MSYALNTAIGSRKLTLSSSGEYNGPIYNPTFTMTKALINDERLINLVFLESVPFKHPTLFSNAYMSGTIVANQPATN